MSDIYIFIEIPATLNSLSKRKPKFGVGTNDASYMVNPVVNGSRSMCPYYKTWSNMIARSYSVKYQEKYPTYKGCSVTKEWLTFSNFRKWMETQDWKGKHLDKDILVIGNKQYGPDTCIFVSGKINTLFLSNDAVRGEYPQGVTLSSGKYQAECRIDGRGVYLGKFKTINEAEITYLLFKSKLVKSVAVDRDARSIRKLQKALLRYAEALTCRANYLMRSIAI